MKKSKIALAAVVATALGVSALGLVACGEDDKPTDKDKGVYTITFDANGGDFASDVKKPVTRRTLGGKLTSFPESPTVAPSAHPDHTFKGWAYSSSATADDALKLPVEFTGDKTLYAIWGGTVTDDGAYVITFDPNGGEVIGESTMTTVGGKLTSTLPTARNDKKQFLGWYTVKDSTSETDKVVVNVTPFTADGKVYASWGEEAAQEYFVTFDANGGTFDNSESTKAIKTQGGVIANLPKPARVGHTFDGYFFDAQSDARPFTSATKVTESNVTVYARWTPLPSDDYISVAGVKTDLIDRSAWLADQTDGRDVMYSIGSEFEDGVDLKAGDEVTFTVDGAPIAFYINPDSTGVDTSVTSEQVNKATVTEADNFEIYVVHYPDGDKPACWTVEFKGKNIHAPEYDDGIYRGDTLVKALVAHVSGEVKVEHVKLETGDVITFKYENEDVSVSMKEGDANSKRVTTADGKLTVVEGGTFTMYLTLDGGGLWVVDEADAVDPELKEGDGMIAGDVVMGAFELNADGINEVMAKGVVLAEQTELSLKYAGAAVVDFTLKSDSHVLSSALSDGKLTLDAGTYNFYYDYASKQLYVGIVDATIKPSALYLYGMVNGWDLNPAYELVGGTITVVLPNNSEFKVVKTTESGKLDWDNQPNFTLSSHVAEVISNDRNIKITGGEATYVITVSGTIVSVKKEGEAPDPVYDKDGVYVGGELVKEFAKHNDNEVKLENVTFEAGSTLVFVYGGKEIDPVIKKNGEGKPCTSKIVIDNGAYKCPDGGTFTMYYQHTGDMGLWIEDLPDRVQSELKEGDGMIAGETVYAFVLNEGGLNEVMFDGADGNGIVLEQATALTLKYAGAAVTDFTLKKGSLGELNEGTLTLAKGTGYKFYYNYVDKTLYVAGKEDVGEIPEGFVQTVKGDQDENNHPNVYLVGKYGGLTQITKDYGKLVAYEKDENGAKQYKITVTLTAGDEVAIWIPDWNLLCSNAESGCASTVEITTHGTDKYMKVKASGEYTFYFKNIYGGDSIWITAPAA